MKKGFTLVELLAVLIILGLILTITYYSVSSILDSSRNSLSDTQESALIEAAKVYYLEAGMNLEADGSYNNKVCVTVAYLINNGYVDKSRVADPSSPSSNLEGYVLITRSNTNNYTYQYKSDSTVESGCLQSS